MAISPTSLDEVVTTSPSAAQVVPHLSTSYDEVGPTTPPAALVWQQSRPPPYAEARHLAPLTHSPTLLDATTTTWTPPQPLSPVARPWCLPTSPPTSPDPGTIPQAAASSSRSIQSSASLSAYIRAHQHPTFQAPAPGTHPAAALLQSYITDGFPAEVGPAWPLASIKAGIKMGPHTSTLTPAATAFFPKELLERVSRGFSIILSQADALTYFGTRLKISRLASVDQVNRKPRLICNSSSAPDTTTASVNDTTDMSANPHAIQFGGCIARIL